MEKTNPITKVNDAFYHVEKTISWIAFAVMLALLLIQVICRYMFHMPLAWAEELVRYTYIGVSFLGAAVALREKSHISIDILPSLLQSKIKDEAKKEFWLTALDIFASIVQFVFFIFISKWMIEYNIDLQVKAQITTANQWQMWIMCLPVTISCILMAFHALLNTIEDFFKMGSIKKSKGKAVA